MKPLISVLIAAYRAEKWLQECIDSTLRQALPPDWEMEILIGVDACEETLESVRQLEYPRVTRFYFSQNVGTYVVFNTLMRHANGSLICRFDADDVMLDDYLVSQIEAHEKGADIIRTWFIFTDENLQPISHIIPYEVHHSPDGRSTQPSVGQLVFSRRVWEGIGGFRAWPCNADTEYFIRAKLVGFRTQVVERHLYLRRRHAASLTAHPDTNFESPLRNRLSEITRGYRAAMLNGEMGTFVQPHTTNQYQTL